MGIFASHEESNLRFIPDILSEMLSCRVQAARATANILSGLNCKLVFQLGCFRGEQRFSGAPVLFEVDLECLDYLLGRLGLSNRQIGSHCNASYLAVLSQQLLSVLVLHELHVFELLL